MIPQDRHVPEHLFLVRHGVTVWDRERRLQGQLDSPLTEDGVRQVRALATRLDGSGITEVCSSPLGRALRTAEILASHLGVDVIEMEDLSEVHHGEMAGLTWEEVEERFPGARADRAANRYGWAFAGGESYAQARARARRALSECGWESRGVPLLITHEMIGRMLRAELRGLDAATALALRHPHDLVIEFAKGVELVR